MLVSMHTIQRFPQICGHSVARVLIASGIASGIAATPFVANADVWVFEPTAAIDQRFDDNYTISPSNPEKVTASRLVGTLGLSRESQSAKFTGLFRADALLTNSNQNASDLSSNQILFFDTKFNSARSVYGIGFNFKQDTPSRDISADLTDISSVAADTGASVTQDENVARRRLVINPNWQYNLSRRAKIATEFTYTQVEHELPTAEESLQKQLALARESNPALEASDIGVFTVFDELDDYHESAIDLKWSYQLTPIVTFSVQAGYSDYTAQSEINDQIVDVPFEQKEFDPDDRNILRNPKRDSRSKTATFRLGYDRALTPTLNVGVQVGLYTNETDDTDMLRESDVLKPGLDREEQLAGLLTKQDGWLANVTLTKSTGITRYTGKFGVDVLPSDVGSQVESMELVGDMFREIGPLLDFSFRVRAYEPDALNNVSNSAFSRRFLSMEPKLIWRFSRAWTAAASYRYRRQKSRDDFNSGESNALLFSLKYTPPSAIRDAELNK